MQMAASLPNAQRNRRCRRHATYPLTGRELREYRRSWRDYKSGTLWNRARVHRAECRHLEIIGVSDGRKDHAA
jgi:hypothetical protein